LIQEGLELARVLIALLVSVAFLALHLAVKPFARVEDGVIACTIEAALILIYIGIILVKACNESSDVCIMFGFGDTASGVYLFFIFFSLGMLLLLLLIGIARLYYAGYVPKVIRLASTHSLSVGQIAKRVARRRTREIRRRLAKALRFDSQRLTPRKAAAVLKYRSTRGRAPPPGVAKELLPIVTGSLAELHIESIFPRTQCFVQIDVHGVVAIRWTQDDYVSAQLVEDQRHCHPPQIIQPIGEGNTPIVEAWVV